MLRSAFLCALTAAGLALPTSSADAHPPVTYPGGYPTHRPPVGYPGGYPTHRPPAPYPGGYPTHRPHCDAWRVLYRTCHHEPWRVYDTYRSEYRARHAAHGLRTSGYLV